MARYKLSEVVMRIKDKVDKDNTELEYYIGGGEFYGHNAKQLPSVMADELRSFMWAYITRRLLWCLGFVIVAGVLGIKTLNKYNQTARSHRPAANERTSRQRPSRTTRPHISTRRR